MISTPPQILYYTPSAQKLRYRPNLPLLLAGSIFCARIFELVCEWIGKYLSVSSLKLLPELLDNNSCCLNTLRETERPAGSRHRRTYLALFAQLSIYLRRPSFRYAIWIGIKSFLHSYRRTLYSLTLSPSHRRSLLTRAWKFADEEGLGEDHRMVNISTNLEAVS